MKKFANKAFLRNFSNDITQTLRIEKKALKAISKAYFRFNIEFIKLFRQMDKSGEVRESIEMLDATALLAGFQAEVALLEVNLDDRMKAIIHETVNDSYNGGIRTAQQQINITQQPIRPVPPTLTRADKIRIQTLKDTDFSLIKTLNTRHTAEARAIVVQGLVDGLSRKEIIKEMTTRLKNTQSNAHRIVRTEIIRNANLAARRRFTETGTTVWQWNTSLDERVCPVCAPLHGKAVKIGDSFDMFLSDLGKKRSRHLPKPLTMPPAHPQCRCGVSIAFKPTIEPKKKKIIKKSPEPKIKIVGFTASQKSEINRLFKVFPTVVKKKIKVLSGIEPIIKTKGRIVDNPEVKSLVSPAILNKHRKATGMYLGAKVNKVFVANTSGNKEVTHEVGHAIHDEYLLINPKLISQWLIIHNLHLVSGDFISPRSSINPKEHFADSIRFYLLEPLTLKIKFPEIYDFINKNVAFGNEIDKIVTLEDGFMYNTRGIWKKWQR